MADRSEEFFCAHLVNLIRTVEQKDFPVFSSFLDLHQQALAEKICMAEHFHAWCFDETIPDAERRMLGLAPSYLTPDQLEFPIAVLAVTWPARFSLTHRDLLGSLLALGIKRETLGDFLIAEGRAELAVQEHLASMISNQLTKIGRVGVKVEQIPAITLSQNRQFQEISGTVPSLRLDVVVALAVRLSRGKAVQLIHEGRVQINGLCCESVSQLVQPGDRLSIRGFGKYQLAKEIGITRRDRLHVVIRKYI